MYYGVDKKGDFNSVHPKPWLNKFLYEAYMK